MKIAGTPAQCRPLDDETDAVLAAEAVHRNAEAMRVLFQRYRATVFNIARRILHDDGEAEDVCQQVYFETFAGIEKFDPDKSPFKNWLLKRAYHRSINRRQHLEAEGFYRSERVEDHPGNTGQGRETRLNLLPTELSHLTEELLRFLSSRERQVIKLIFYESLTRAAVADRLGITVSAVRHSLRKGLQRMHSALLNGRKGTRKDHDVKP